MSKAPIPHGAAISFEASESPTAIRNAVETVLADVDDCPDLELLRNGFFSPSGAI